MDHDALRAKIRARVPRSSSGRWFDIRNAEGDTTVVRIYDFIDPWGVTAEDFASALAQISTPKIEVQINSPGGDVWDGIAIFNALRAHPAHVTTRVDGMAASAASVIVQAGDHRVMMHAGQMMIHDAWGLCIGSAAEMRQFADVLEQQSSIIADIYATRAGGDHTAEAFRELMLAETWLTDQGAVDAGLADEVLKPETQDPPSNALTRADLEWLRDEVIAKIPAEPAGTPDPEPGGPTNDSDAESFLRAVLAHSQGENQ